jgi:ribonuclease HII
MPRPPKIEAPRHPDLSAENELWQRGLHFLAGLDEAGRGAWAGPVAAGAVILPPDPGLLARLSGVRDSKQMSARQRAYWADEIKACAVAWGVGMCSAAEIDQWGILPATRTAMQRALNACAQPGEHLLIDALRLPKISLPQTVLVKGDARCLSIAAASVLAKTARDAWMCALDAQFPQYHFAAHKGYGTAAHQRALSACGPCPQHRFSFRPVRLAQESWLDPLSTGSPELG